MLRREKFPNRMKSRRFTAPVHRWKQAVMDSELYEAGLAIAAPPSEAPPPSARKLAASLWELEEVSFPVCIHSPDRSLRHSPSEAEDPDCSPFSQPDYVRSTPTNRRQSKTGAHGGVKTRLHRMLTQTAVDSGDECAHAPRTPSRIDRRRHIPSSPIATGGTFDLPSPSETLLKVFQEFRLLEDQHILTFVSAFHEQLLEAHARVQELESLGWDTESVPTRSSEEKRSWKAREKEAVRAALQPLKEDLEEANESLDRLERANRRLTKELTEAHTAAADLVDELEEERRTRHGLEKRCEELEREKWDLQTAEELREERVRMKLGEASHDLQAKSDAMDGLRVQLEAFLASTRERPCDMESFRDARELHQALSDVHYDTSISTLPSARSSGSSVSSTASYNPNPEYVANLDTDFSHGSRSRGRALLLYPKGIPDAD